MTVEQNILYAKLVQDWENKNASDLPLTQRVILLEKAIHVIEQRALMTLSSITLEVILDRVRHQSIEKFPLLTDVKFNNKHLNFQELLHKKKKHKEEDLVEALRYFLIEFITVLGRITADILTTPLHRELLKVKWTDPEEI